MGLTETSIIKFGSSSMQNELDHIRKKAVALEKENQNLRKRLQESERLFYHIFHAASNPMIITTIKEGRIVALNEANANLNGYKSEELIGRTTSELDFWVDPNQRDIFVRKLREMGKVHNIEVSAKAKNGNIKTILLSANPITVNGKPCLLGMSKISLNKRRKLMN
jgi:PAS domain S-box-containing protein